jgi:hypothetical protein
MSGLCTNQTGYEVRKESKEGFQSSKGKGKVQIMGDQGAV